MKIYHTSINYKSYVLNNAVNILPRRIADSCYDA